MAAIATATAGTTWDGGGANASWGTANNWNPDGLPLFNGTETITLGTAFTSGTTLTLDGTRNISSLLINTISAFTIATGTGGSLGLFSGNITRQDVVGTELGQTISANVILGDPAAIAAYTGTWNIAGSNSLNLSGVVSETGGVRGITKTGTGIVILSGTNTFSGGLTLNAGIVQISSDANLGASSGSLTFNGGAIYATDNVVSARAIIMTGAGIFYTTFGKTLEESGVISGNGNLTTANSGTLILSGSGSNGTGTTTVSGASLSLRGTVALGSGVLTLSGGLLELGNGNFTRALGTAAGQVNMNSASGGAGFSAFGADRTVNLGGSGATVTWGVGNFVANAQPLYLGTPTADHMIDFQNPINLNGASRTITVTDGVGTGVDAKLSGVISGIGSSNLVINSVGFAPWNPGTVLLSNGNNSYAGFTFISSGTLLLGANATGTAGNTVLGSGASEVFVGNTSGALNAGLLTDGAVTINRDVRVLSGNTGTISIGGYTADMSTFSGSIFLGTASAAGKGVTLTAASGGTATFSGVVQDAAGALSFGLVTKNGAGTVVLSGANTYAGLTAVSAGVLNIQNAFALGSTAAGTTIASGATLQLQGGIAIGAEALTLNGSGVGGFGALRNISGNNSFAGNITLGSSSIIQSLAGLLTLSGNLDNGGSGRSFEFSGDGDTTVSGVINNDAPVIKNGTGTLRLSGANTFSGSTTINAGTLVAEAASGSALGGTSGITVGATGILELGANDQINNTASVTLAGGTLFKGAFGEGSAISAGMGSLNLTASGSTIDFGTGAVGTLAFSIFNPGSDSLTISNWTGTPNVAGDATTDRLIFASDPTAILNQFVFTDYLGAAAIALGGGFYEVTPLAPVPEVNPAMAASLLCALLAIFVHRRAVLAKIRRD